MGDQAKSMRETLENSPDYRVFVGTLSKEQMAYHAKSVGAIAGACEKNNEKLLEHIDEMCVSKVHLDDQEQNVYMPTLKDAMEKVGERISKDVARQIAPISKDVGELKRRRKEDRGDIDKIDAEQKLMKHQLSSMAGEIRMLSSVPAQINSVHDTVNRLFDAVNHKKPSAQKSNSMSNLSNKQLILIGAGIVLGMTAVMELLFTGESTVISVVGKIFGAGGE